MLVAVGILGIVIATCTLKRIERQTKATETAAKAALNQANYMVASERPWMMIEAKYEGVADYPIYTFRFVNRGKSPAEIVNQFAEFRFVPIQEESDLPSEPKYGKYTAPEWEIVHHPWYIPDEGFEVYQLDARVIGETDSEKWEAIKTFKIRLYFIGIVRYRDTLDTEIHESRFCYAAGSRCLIPFGPTAAYNKLT